MEHTIFTELSLVIVVAALVSLIMRALRQPQVLGYILTGILVGPSALELIHSREAFEGFSTIGIALLLFIIGLGLNIAVIRRVGKSVFLTAAALLVIVGGAGFAVSQMFLGFSVQEAYLIGLSLFFSSTIIIVKFLTDKKEQNRLHGQIAIGIILLDDIVATIALLFVAAGKDHTVGIEEVGSLLGRGLLLLAFLVAASRYILPRLAKSIAATQESLFLFAIAWGFGVASFFEFSGFSIEIGALFAGVSLAGLPYAQEIESRLKPLRDFFVVLFFIALGESLNVTNLQEALIPAVVLSGLVIVFKPAIVTTLLGMFGFPKRVAFKAGINLSQISEFSIVLIVLAATNGLVDQELTSIITLVAMITIASSSYLMQYDNALFSRFDSLRLFSGIFRREHKTPSIRARTQYQLFLFGYHRGGHQFIRTFQSLNRKFLVVDYDPAVIELLQNQHIACQYGDATDSELLEEIGVRHAKLVVSTITDFETNLELARHVNLYNPEAVIICNANSYDEALQLYELGCSYVIIPHYAGSEHLSSVIQRNGIERQHFDSLREKHLKHLQSNHPLGAAEDAF
jgi:Kef-type K+ transport system membrane component KefB